MQDISLHIEYLLRHHDCVIMPGIGAFLRAHTPAVCDAEGIVRAPRLQICFNSSITSSDGLLSHSLARRNKISFEEATAMLNTVSEYCRNALLNDGELTIGHLGTLRMDSERHICFTPYSPIYNDIWTARTPHSLYTASTNGAVESNRRDFTDSELSKYYIIKVSRKAVRYAALVAVCIFTAATMLLPSASRQDDLILPNKQYASVVPGVDKLSSGNTTTTKSVEISSCTNTNPVCAEPIADTQQTVTNSHKYYLIVATFSQDSDCKKFINARGSNETLRIVSGAKVSRVYSASSDDKAQLLDILNSSQHQALYPQAWIWTNPNASTL